MKHSLVPLLFLLSFLFLTNCSEDDMLMSTYLPTDVDIQAMDSNPKRPVLKKVITDGSKVTLEFTNPAAPKKPEGGFELILNGKRTYTNTTPRLNSDQKYLRMSFTLDKSDTHRFQIYARWNTGYLRSNEVWGKVEDNATTNSITSPDNPKRPVVYDVVTDGRKVTVKFANFTAPKQPEGGFELILDGKRTYTNITKRVFSDQKYASMTFYLDNPTSRCYQIYARWNTGYLRSDDFCPGQDTPLSTTTSSTSSGDFPGMPSLKLVKRYEFEDNIGKDVSFERDGLRHNNYGRQDGKVVSVDGVGAYRFRITPTGGQYSYRHELIPRDLPYPYFDASNGFESNWNKEYVYEIRMKLSDNYQTGRGYTSFFGAKNDYTVSRLGPFTQYIDGDHYWTRQFYATYTTTNRRGEASVYNYLDAEGNKLKPGVNFNTHTKLGPGYPTIENDKGKWVTWTYYVKWTYDFSGFIKVYKNGKLFYSYTGPTGFKDKRAPYIKFGLYNSYWKQGHDTGAYAQESFVDYLRVYVPK